MSNNFPMPGELILRTEPSLHSFAVTKIQELVSEFEPVLGLLEELTKLQDSHAQFPNPCYVCIAVMSA